MIKRLIKKIAPEKEMTTSPGEAQNQWSGKNLELSRNRKRIGSREERWKKQFAKCAELSEILKA